MNFDDNFFIDMAPTMPTFYDDFGLATEGLLAEGLSPTRGGGDQATLDFSSVGFGFGDPLSFGIDNIYAPFDGPSFSCSYDPLPDEPLWNIDDLLAGNTGLPSTSGPSTDDVASSHNEIVQRTERHFASDISNGKERVAEPIPQSLSRSPSSNVSPAEVETPTNSSYAEESFDIYTASSSPAGKSAKQRRSAASPTARKTRKGTPLSDTSPVEEIKASIPRKNIPCLEAGCNAGPFFCVATMHRHVISKHLNLRSECPGCRSSLSRKDSLSRHINSRPIGSHCRVAARDNGWEEDEDGSLSLPEREGRVDPIFAEYGRTR